MAANNVCECIYCRRQLPIENFNREHVLSSAFGRFSDAPVLHDAVCSECNQFFGNMLETRVARGAFEGMLRYQRGIRRPQAGNLDLRYVEFTIPEGSDWCGVRLRLAWRDDRLVVDLLSQAAFFDRAKSQWVHLTRKEIEAGVLSRFPTLETKKGGRIYARSLEERNGLLELLERQGIAFAKLEDMSPPPGLVDGEISVEVSLTINKGIRRCMAKYSFNFLALVCGAAFVLESDFDVIRRFSRYGEAPAYPLVAESFRPILRDDSLTRRQTSGHLLTIDWAESGIDLVGQVSLFNSITYSISLTRRYTSGLWRPIRSGLHYNIQKRTVEQLFSSSALVLP